MSFILDALKKSETDRQRQSAPVLFEVKVAAPRRRFPMWAVGLAVLLGVNMLVLGWVLLRHSGNDSPAAAAAQSAGARAAGARAAGARAAGARAAGAQAAPPAAAAIGAPVQSSSGEVTVPATVTFQVQVPANTLGTTPAPASGPGVVAPSAAPPLAEEPLLSGQQTAVPPDYDSRDYQPAITPEQAGATAAARRAGQLPSRDEILARGTQLPDLRMDLHVYDADPAKRFVFINMRKLREGESLPEGVRVDEITQSGAKLTYQGNQFALGGN